MAILTDEILAYIASEFTNRLGTYHFDNVLNPPTPPMVKWYATTFWDMFTALREHGKELEINTATPSLHICGLGCAGDTHE